MTTAPAVRNIPLNRLVLSPTNVRKTPPSAAEEAELKASIKARGLKQNLVVHLAADANGVHAVTAGGRRLKALQKLAGEGVIPADFKVPCLDGLTVRDQEPEISNPSPSSGESGANSTKGFGDLPPLGTSVPSKRSRLPDRNRISELRTERRPPDQRTARDRRRGAQSK
jgi:ParB family chromosome partitioning protein